MRVRENGRIKGETGREKEREEDEKSYKMENIQKRFVRSLLKRTKST